MVLPALSAGTVAVRGVLSCRFIQVRNPAQRKHQIGRKIKPALLKNRGHS
jgi:hypothetical protein